MRHDGKDFEPYITVIRGDSFVIPKVTFDEIERLRKSLQFERGESRALKRMLIRKATLLDYWCAWRKKGHWLNCFRHEVLIP